MPDSFSPPTGRLFSVGHSNLELETFLRLLQAAGVTVLADVRSSPFSRYRPQFNKASLEQTSPQAGIGYLFLGHLLGGRPSREDLYDAEGHVDYERVRATKEFQQGLEQLLAARERDSVAMMCSEEDPLDCHRLLMITPALVERGLEPLHLRKDGSVETTRAMEERLLDETEVGKEMRQGLFAELLTEVERRQMLVEAYRAMSRTKGFRLKRLDEEGDAP